MLNPFFNISGSPNEESLVESLIIESIQIYGKDIVYIPKVHVDYDALRGEDPSRAFITSYTVEAYFENVDGWMGQGNAINQMGLNIEKQAIFVVSKKRFDEVMNPSITFVGYWDPTVTYSANQGVIYNAELWNSVESLNLNIVPGTDSNAWVRTPQVRPYEGDLIYLPLTHDIFEINYADHEEVFYQLGKIYVWKITCEKFRFSHEQIATGVSDIDTIAIENANNDSIVNDPLADNDNVTTQIQNFLEIDSNNPFNGGN